MNKLFDHEKLSVYRLGSALECAAALDILVAKGRCELTAITAGKERLRGIVSMQVGLIKANSDYQMHEGD